MRCALRYSKTVGGKGKEDGEAELDGLCVMQQRKLLLWNWLIIRANPQKERDVNTRMHVSVLFVFLF